MKIRGTACHTNLWGSLCVRACVCARSHSRTHTHTCACNGRGETKGSAEPSWAQELCFIGFPQGTCPGGHSADSGG